MRIVRRVEHLPLGEAGVGPVAGAGFLGFLQFLAEEVGDGDFGADGAPVAGAAQGFAEVEDVFQGDAEPGFEGAAVVAEAEADFQHLW